MRITVVGTGYVGLVSGACLAESGNDVLCLDLDQAKIDQLNRGGIHLYEPGLPEMVDRNVAAGRLRFTCDIDRSVEHGSVQILAVGTPPGEDGSADLSHILAAARNIGARMTAEKIVVNKSTVPVGSAQKVRSAIAGELGARGLSLDFHVVSNPEFLKEGAAVDDFMSPDRIVVGADSDKALAVMRELYAPFQRSRDRMIVMDPASAELTKYAANAMLATRISFMNDLANLAERLGVDIEMVRQGIGADPRIGYQFLYAGCGYGGSCFPKDVKALLATARGEGVDLRVLAAVQAVNEGQKVVLVEKARARFRGELAGKHFALWGLAFKPNTDDLREAPALEMAERLTAAGATVSAYDPVAADHARRLFAANAAIRFAPTALQACEGADALLIATEWKEFRAPDFPALKQALKQPVIFDGRNLYNPSTVRSLGFEYHAIGR